jgi:hypothetical protein
MPRIRPSTDKPVMDRLNRLGATDSPSQPPQVLSKVEGLGKVNPCSLSVWP